MWRAAHMFHFPNLLKLEARRDKTVFLDRLVEGIARIIRAD
jgi:hypothetical protein